MLQRRSSLLDNDSKVQVKMRCFSFAANKLYDGYLATNVVVEYFTSSLKLTISTSGGSMPC